MKVKSHSRVQLLATPWTAAHQAPLSMVFSRQEYWNGVPLPSLFSRQPLPNKVQKLIGRFVINLLMFLRYISREGKTFFSLSVNIFSAEFFAFVFVFFSLLANSANKTLKNPSDSNNLLTL